MGQVEFGRSHLRLAFSLKLMASKVLVPSGGKFGSGSEIPLGRPVSSAEIWAELLTSSGLFWRSRSANAPCEIAGAAAFLCGCCLTVCFFAATEMLAV